MKDSLRESVVAVNTSWFFQFIKKFVLSLMSFLERLELSDLIKLQINVTINFLQCSDKLPK
jgi:hypothetical protein